MRSWSLKKFVEEFSIKDAVEVWGVKRQAVDKALAKKRDIQIIYLDGYWEVHESKLLSKVKARVK